MEMLIINANNFCMKTKLYNIFKTTNAMASSKTFKKVLTKFYKYHKIICSKTTRTIYNRPSNLELLEMVKLLLLNFWHYFFTKSIKLHFFYKFHLQTKTHIYGHQVGNNHPFKIFKNYLFPAFFGTLRKFSTLNFTFLNNIEKDTS